ncbi:MAG: hypothetical protein A2Y69_15495 [Candidatus Aminicenantes bacterium RBG_13_59_9]|nr:MAG: hypothetical protein A2Y69_15495 [Candidatus Aminicenantes bacterium RBG_13_59_9]
MDQDELFDGKNDGGKAPTRPAAFLAQDELFGGFVRVRGTSLFLGKFSLAEVSAVLGKKGFLREARKRGLWPLTFDMDSSEFPYQRFQIFYSEKKPENLIVDLKFRETVFHLKNPLLYRILPQDYRLLAFEWLTLQNPRLHFTPERPGLPGQAAPGLNLSKKVVDLFVYIAKLQDFAGLMAYPAYYHNALLFSRYFRFVNPDKWGEVLAIHRSLPHASIKQLAWLVHWNCLRDGAGNVYEWKSEEQILPLNKSLRRYFASRTYQRHVRHALKKLKFSVDWDLFRRKTEESGMRLT